MYRTCFAFLLFTFGVFSARSIRSDCFVIENGKIHSIADFLLFIMGKKAYFIQCFFVLFCFVCLFKTEQGCEKRYFRATKARKCSTTNVIGCFFSFYSVHSFRSAPPTTRIDQFHRFTLFHPVRVNFCFSIALIHASHLYAHITQCNISVGLLWFAQVLFSKRKSFFMLLCFICVVSSCE